MDNLACPCGVGDDYDSCCGRVHRASDKGGEPARTAEQLMRARYSAFAIGDADYVLRSWHPTTRPRTLTLDPDQKWIRLAVLETHEGGLFDTVGTVRFRALYKQNGRRGTLDEISRFVREDGQWLYLDAVR
ncbi:MAG TPA: YchJ family metal-binding protein [Trebonia sp.]